MDPRSGARQPEPQPRPLSGATLVRRRPGRHSGDRTAEPPRRLLRLVPLVLAAATFLVHDVGYLLRQPFWLDESWVAVSTRARLGDLRLVTSSTPLGWTLLLRLTPGSGQQHYRLLPLAFAAGAVVLAYLLGRTSPVLPGLCGLGSGLVVLLLPAMLVRDDLKQYTADAAVALLLLLLAARLDTGWSARRLRVLAPTLVLCALLSHAALLVGAAVLPAVLLVAVLRRPRGRLPVAVQTVGAGAVGLLAVYVLADAGTRGPALAAYWRSDYVPTNRGLGAAWRFVETRAQSVPAHLGVGSRPLAGVLLLAGLATLVAARRWVVATTMVLLPAELLTLGVLHRYPLLDQRTSTFLFALLAVLMVTGVAGIVTLAARWTVRAAVPVLALLAATVWAVGVWPGVRAHVLPREDVREQAAYVEAHWRPGDVVLLSFSADWGFAYYATRWTPRFVSDAVPANGFIVEYPSQDEIVVPADRNAGDVEDAFARARLLQRQTIGARLWVVRTHLVPPEAAAWRRVLTGQRATAIPTGAEPLIVVRPAAG